MFAVAGASLAADERRQRVVEVPLRTESSVHTLSNLPTRFDLRAGVEASSLKIEHVRLEPPPSTESLPSTLLKFDVLNESSGRLTDLVLEVSIVEKPTLADSSLRPRVLVGPFTIQGDVILESGYTINYEMLLRNFSSDCYCLATVEAVSARSVPDSGK
jgi:hypothetical protein